MNSRGERISSPECGWLSAEPLLHSLEHQVAHIRSADAGVRRDAPGDDLSVMGIDDERAADDIAVPAGELEARRCTTGGSSA